jgi:transposase
VASKRKPKPKAKRPVGRPRTEMTDENIAAILRTVALGVWPDRAAQMHGVSADAMRMHKMRHPEFVTSLEKAEAQAESGFLGKILRHTEKQWTAAAWMLERRWPDRWAKRELVQEQTDIEPDARFE